MRVKRRAREPCKRFYTFAARCHDGASELFFRYVFQITYAIADYASRFQQRLPVRSETMKGCAPSASHSDRSILRHRGLRPCSNRREREGPAYRAGPGRIAKSSVSRICRIRPGRAMSKVPFSNTALSSPRSIWAFDQNRETPSIWHFDRG
jgi:hypothetical protein